nr:12007_t:CDS:2 [Entrophospora candida]
MVNKPSKAWVTLITKGSYIKGGICLARSLKKVNSKYPLVVMHTKNVNEEGLSTFETEWKILIKEGCILRPVEKVNPTTEPSKYIKTYYADVWTKFRVWELTEFERVVFLDADMLVIGNIDVLMEKDLKDNKSIAASHACTCNPNKIPGYPENWIPKNCAYTYGPFKPESANNPPSTNHNDYFNSGLMVLNPSIDIYNSIIEYLVNHNNIDSLIFPDQSLLNEFFKDKWIPLPYIYNGLKFLRNIHSEIWEDSAVKNVHYIVDKPWSMDHEKQSKLSESERDPMFFLNNWWWLVYKEIYLHNFTFNVNYPNGVIYD